MSIPIRPTQLAAERRRGEIERATQMQGQVFRISYFLKIEGSGETSVDVNFPVRFQERPAVSSGGELAEGTVLEDGNFPWCSAMASNWVTEERNGQTYYTGCRVIVVVGGTERQVSAVHFTVEGKALQSPVT